MDVLIFSHTACVLHQPGPGHPECPERLQAVVEALRSAFPDLPWREAPQALRSQLARVHSDRLLASILDVEVGDEPYRLDPDTVMSRHSRDAALRCAGAGVAAVDAVLRGEARRAFCAVRPPGHHATADIAMGFCLFNAVAVAALHAVEAHGLQRVAIADFDVHHGNGTQDIVEHDERIMYVSSHQAPLYPGTGGREERGIGNVLNQPLSPGSGGSALRAAWDDQLLPALDAFRPQLLLVSAGFDAHRLDPLADLNASAEDYAAITRGLVEVARRHAGGRVVSLLEGGYSLAALRESSVAHVGALSGN